MRVTIKDIAKKTNLSITTVSLVLNNKPNKISQSTKERIYKAVKELNYMPNQIARALVSDKVNAIGLIIPDITNMYFAELAKIVEKETRKFGYNIMLCDSGNDSMQQIDFIKMLYQNGIKGVIMAISADASTHETTFSMVKKFDMTVVLIDRFVSEYNIDSVVVNNRHGAYMAAKHLLELGHRKIGCITGPDELQDSRERYAGFVQAMNEYGVPIEKSLVYHGDYNMESGICGGEALLNQGVTAIFTFNDMMAYGVYQMAEKHKTRIPQQLSVIGFDNIMFSSLLSVPLTTISQPVNEMGIKAVEILMRKMESTEKKSEIFVFEPEIIIRTSTKKID
jgi:LacI family transcriptional regulator